MFASGHLTRPRRKIVVGLSVAVLVLFAGGCSPDSTDTLAAIEEQGEAAITSAPEPTALATTPPLPSVTPVVVPTRIAETSTPTPALTEDQQAFCGFMATRYFWETEPDEEFLELMPDNVPTSVLRSFRARQILSAPGLGDPRTNSLATMVLFTAFASDLGRYLETECPGVDWVEIAVAHSRDPDFEAVLDPLLPSSDLDLCASLNELEVQLDVDRGRKGPGRIETAVAAQMFASAIDPDVPFEVLAFSHQLLTQATLSSNRVTFDLYIDVAFDEIGLVDAEVVSAYFDLTCPAVRDTRLWLTPPRAAGAITHPTEGEGLPEGWETVPAEDVISSFGGDLRTLPVGQFTPLLTSYPKFDYDGIEFTSLGSSWVTESIDPARAVLRVGWLYDGQELPFDVSQAVVVGPDDTRYSAEVEGTFDDAGFVEFVFVLDFIPESLNDVGFGIVPR